MKTYISNLIVLTLFLVSGQTTKAIAQIRPLQAAEYRLIAAGEPSPFAGVVLSIQTYRAEGAKLKTQARLIDSQKKLLDGLQSELRNVHTEANKREQEVRTQEQLLASCNETTKELQASLLITQRAYADAKPKFYEKPVFWSIIAFSVGTFTGIKIATGI